MKHAIQLCAVCWFCLWQPLKAQDTTNNRLSFSAGLGTLARQDLIFSPLIHRSGSPLQFALVFERHKKLTQKARLSLAQFTPGAGDTYTYWWNDPQQPSSTFPHVFTLIDMDYGLATNLWQTAHWQLTGGAMLQNTIQASSYHFGSFGGFGYLAAFGLGPWLEVAYQSHEKHALQFGLSAPLISWVARSPYLINDDAFIENTYSHRFASIFWEYMQDGAWQSVGQFQLLSVQWQYTYAVSRKAAIIGQYRFTALHHSDPLSFLSFQQVFSLGAGIKF